MILHVLFTILFVAIIFWRYAPPGTFGKMTSYVGNAGLESPTLIRTGDNGEKPPISKRAALIIVILAVPLFIWLIWPVGREQLWAIQVLSVSVAGILGYKWSFPKVFPGHGGKKTLYWIFVTAAYTVGIVSFVVWVAVPYFKENPMRIGAPVVDLYNWLTSPPVASEDLNPAVTTPRALAVAVPTGGITETVEEIPAGEWSKLYVIRPGRTLEWDTHDTTACLLVRINMKDGRSLTFLSGPASCGESSETPRSNSIKMTDVKSFQFKAIGSPTKMDMIDRPAVSS